VTLHAAQQLRDRGGVWTGLLRDDASGARTTTGPSEPGRSSGAPSTVAYANGNRLCVHADGTAIVTASASTRVLTTAQGTPPLTLAAVFDNACAVHALGALVTLARAGRRTRGTATLPDSSILALDGDVSVTAGVSGRLRLHRPDGWAVLAV